MLHLVKCQSAEVLEGVWSHQLSTDLSWNPVHIKHWSARPPRRWECPQTGTWGVWGRWRWLTAVLGCWWRCAPPHYSTALVPRYHIDAFEGHDDSHLPPVKVDGFELCVSPVTLGSFFGRGQRLVGKMWWPKTWIAKINFFGPIMLNKN